MSGLTGVPKPHVANTVAIADFAEIECLRQVDGNVSTTDVSRALQRESSGTSDEAVDQRVAEAFEEMEARLRHCGPADGRYPFTLENNGTLLQLRESTPGTVPSVPAYVFLLLATRMDMKRERNQGGYDATALFEQLCREVVSRFLGGPGNGTEALVFGTGRLTENLKDDDELHGSGFAEKINHLCKRVGEGGAFREYPSSRVTAKDGKLDVVVWRRFADRREGQLIGFAQCKTGTHWQSDLEKLQPEGFCAKWMCRRPAVLPVRMYCVADRVVDHWYEHCIDGGILFDRCRIMEFTSNLPPSLSDRIDAWVRAAARPQGLTVP